jgi:hypothetical protein
MTTHHIVHNVPTKCHDFLYLVQRECKQSIATAIMYVQQINYQLIMLICAPKQTNLLLILCVGPTFC